MAKAEVVGEVAMLVVADAGKFAGDLQKKVKKAVSKLSQASTFAPLTRALARAGEDAGEAFSRAAGARTRRKSRKSGDDVGKSFIQGVVEAVKNGTSILSTAAGTAVEAVGAAFKTGLTGFTGGFSGIVGAISSLASAGPAGIAIGLGALVAGLLALVTIGPAVIGGLVAITAALSSLIGLIAVAPAGLAVLLAAIVPLVIAFQGFGDTISALASGDMDKFNEAIKKLAPNARKVALEIKGLMPFFSELRKNTQNAFFGPLVGGITQLVKAIGPTVSRGITGLAAAFGLLARNLIDVASRPEVARTFQAIFLAANRIIFAFNRPTGNFFLALTNAARAALPGIEALFGGLATGLDKFANFINRSIKDGSFKQFLDSAISTLNVVLGIGKDLIVVFGDLFLNPGLEESGRGFLQGVRNALQSLHQFFQSKDGKQFLNDLITLAGHLKGTLGDLAPVLGWLLEQFTIIAHGAVVLLGLIDKILGKSKRLPDSASIGRAAGNIVKGAFAGGGETSQDGLYRLAEGNRREVILPMTNPARARQVAAETGVTGMLLGNQNASFNVKVYIGTRELEDVVGVEVNKSNQRQARDLASGPRTE